VSARVTDIACTSLPLSGTGEETAAWAASVLDDAGMAADALYVATSDGGAREALAFWAAARGTGLAFANPRAFPWTLANSATGRISQVLGIHGPCTTYVGGAEAFGAAGQNAEDDIAAGLVASALVVGLHGEDSIRPDGGTVRVSLVARRLGGAG
jgi:3-oxoacyl-(acyl-carrier-protein) synthase